jgi:tocopherol O-methyltransferase
MGTPQSLRQQVLEYFDATTESSYLSNWSGDTLALHFGLSDASTRSHEESLERSNQLLAERAGVSVGTRVLDAGCGVGGSAIWLARDRGAKVVGITLSERQVELALGFAARAGVSDSTDFLVRDYLATGFASSSFEVVWNLESLCHAADPHAYLAHAKELLVDGGRFVCLDLFRGDGGDPSFCDEMCRGWVLPSLRGRGEIAAMLIELGFSEVTELDLTQEVKRSAVTMRQMALARMAILSREPAPNPISLAHTAGALGASGGLLSGAVHYAFVGGKRGR